MFPCRSWGGGPPGVGGRGGIRARARKRPELRGDCTFSAGAGARKGQIPVGIAVFLMFLLRFSFSVAFVSLLGCVFRWFPESAYHGGMWEGFFGGFWGAFGPGQRPGKARKGHRCQWGLPFLSCFCCVSRFLLLLFLCRGGFFAGVPNLLTQMRGRLTRSVVDKGLLAWVIVF